MKLRLREVRLARKYSQVRLAVRSGIDKTTLGEIKRGERPASPAILRTLAETLGVALEDLVAADGADAAGNRSRPDAPNWAQSAGRR
jgi:transcriptional regulator with XRE-family HTH domain